MALLARNESVVQLHKIDTIKEDYPIYGDMVSDQFERGNSRNKDYVTVYNFFKYLGERKSDRLPRMPVTFIDKLFAYLCGKDVDDLRDALKTVKLDALES